MINLDWGVLLNILQVGSILGAWLWMFLSMRSELRIVRHDLVNLERAQQALNEAFKQLGTILTQVAVQDTRLGMIEKNIDELRHGRGFIAKDRVYKEDN